MLLEDDSKIVEVARMYYEENMTQNEIAEKLYVSRPTISKLLKTAREEGIVQITIQPPMNATFDLEKSLEEKYKLDEVCITPNVSDPHQKKTLVGIRTAKFVSSKMHKINSLGLGWGTTIYEFVRAANYHDYNNLDIYPLMGGLGLQNVAFHSNHLCFKLSEKYNANVHYLYAPAIAENEAVKNVFIDTSLYKEVHKQGLKVDLAISGIANPVISETYKHLENVSDEELQELKEKEVVGDIYASFFDINGEEVITSLSRKMTGVKLSELHKINKLLVLASDSNKSTSIKALLKRDVIDYLIISQDIAEDLAEA